MVNMIGKPGILSDTFVQKSYPPYFLNPKMFMPKYGIPLPLSGLPKYLMQANSNLPSLLKSLKRSISPPIEIKSSNRILSLGKKKNA